ERTNGCEGPAPCHREDVVDELIREAVKICGRNGTREAGGIDEDGYSTRALSNQVGRLRQVGAVGDGGGDGKVPLAGQALQELVALMHWFALQEHDLCAQRRQASCGYRANSAIAAGDHGDFTVEAFARFKRSG